MAKQQVKSSDKQPKKQSSLPQSAPTLFLFGRKNFIVLFIGMAVLAIGFLLMTGGSQPPNQFDPNVVYSFRRTTLSTIVVMIGFLVVLYSIFIKHEETAAQ